MPSTKQAKAKEPSGKASTKKNVKGTKTAKTIKAAAMKKKTTRSPKNKKTQAELDALAKKKQEIAKASGHPKSAVAPKRKTAAKKAGKKPAFKKVEPIGNKLPSDELQRLCDRSTAWQRKMDPSNFNKSRGAQYHTAPTVLTPNDFGFPEDLPLDAITFLFRISDEGWIGEPEKMTVNNPLVIEKEPRKGAKNGPIFILSETAAICTVAYKENYYWSANELAKHKVLRIRFVPEKARTDGKKRNIMVYATFMPDEGK